MKKTVLIVLLMTCLTACVGGNIKPGSYSIENKNDRPIYLIDIKTGERIAELNSGEFYVSIPGNKKIASFLVEFTNFNTQSNSVRAVELGFFNGKAKKEKIDLPWETQNVSEDAIIIPGEQDLLNANTNEVIGKTLAPYGPTLYDSIRDGYCYFYIGVNYVKVRDSEVMMVPRPADTDNQLVEDRDVADLAYTALAVEARELIADHADPLVDQIMLDGKGVEVYNKDLTRQYTIRNQEVVMVIFQYCVDENMIINVYLTAGDYSFLGVEKIMLENETVSEPDVTEE